MRPESGINLGVIQVHKRVIADICTAAIADIQGVSMANNSFVDGVLGVFGVRHNSAVDVRVDTRNQVSVVVKVAIRYGFNLSETSRKIQDTVMTAIEKMADINLKDVDVSIQGVERG
ncbi:MAG: Asp23/Gls24 family envelope stress response protein [Candidatus Omnitrophica bacterium]|nr:Asp23/Gls24 family envelope stress response protein [Candidatus Omnitrophota bacterium]